MSVKWETVKDELRLDRIQKLFYISILKDHINFYMNDEHDFGWHLKLDFVAVTGDVEECDTFIVIDYSGENFGWLRNVSSFDDIIDYMESLHMVGPDGCEIKIGDYLKRLEIE